MIVNQATSTRTCVGAALLLVIFLTSCVTTGTINKWVDQKYENASPAPGKKETDQIKISTTLVTSDPKNSKTSQSVGRWLPLLFYWRFHTINAITLNPKLPYNHFANTAMSYARSKGLKAKLKGQHVELSVTELPNAFSFEDRSHLVFLVVGSVGWDVFYMVPVKTDMVVSYKIMQESNEVKQGVITIPGPTKEMRLKGFGSVKKKAWKCIDAYNDNIDAMSKKVIDSLITEL